MVHTDFYAKDSGELQLCTSFGALKMT